MDGETFEIGFIRSTLSKSRPKNAAKNKATNDPTQLKDVETQTDRLTHRHYTQTLSQYFALMSDGKATSTLYCCRM